MWRFIITPFFILFTVCALPASVTAADAGEGILTLARVIELAAANAPEVRLSTTRVAEAEARLAGAQVRTRENPKMDLATGPRSGPESSVDVEVGFEIPFDLGSRREKRIAVAQAGIQRENACDRGCSPPSERPRQSAHTTGFFTPRNGCDLPGTVRHWPTSCSESPGNGISPAMWRNSRSTSHRPKLPGPKVTFLRHRVASLWHGQPWPKRLGSHPEQSSRLSATSRSGASLTPSVPLRRPGSVPISWRHWLTSRFLGPRSLLAEAERLPDLAFRLSYKREGNENIALGGITVSLPFLNPRRGPVQEARIQNQRAQIAAEVRQAAITAEIEGARRAYDAGGRGCPPDRGGWASPAAGKRIPGYRKLPGRKDQPVNPAAGAPRCLGDSGGSTWSASWRPPRPVLSWPRPAEDGQIAN